MEAKVFVPIIVSCLALGVSILTLYVSRLRAADITIIAGEYTHIYCFDEGNTAVTLPISVSNNGARVAVVRRVALLIQEADSPEGYLFEPINYERIDKYGDFEHESEPHPIAVPGWSTEIKQVLFRSSIEHPDEFRLSKGGSYRLTVLAWLKDSIEPQAADSFSIIITDKYVEDLEKYRAEKKSTAVSVRQSQWRKWGAQKLTEVGTKALGINAG